jgi:2-methylcitrate dehydratase PrpD
MGNLIAFLVSAAFKDLPPEVIQHAKQQILDTLGVIIGGSAAKGCKEVVSLVNEWGGKAESTIPVYGSKVPAPHAGLAIGPMARALELGDTCAEAGHVSEYVIPAMLPTVELVDQVTGPEFILAYILGCEILIRIGEPAFTISSLYDQHKYCMFRYFGPTAAAGKLLRLDGDTLWNATGLAYNQAGGDLQMYDDGVLSVRVQHGFVADAAIKAVLLARRGITGTRNILEGARGGLYVGFYPEHKDLSMVLEGLGEDWKVLHMNPKFHSSCGYSHGAADALIEIVRQNRLRPENVKMVRVDLAKDAYDFICKPEDTSRDPKTIPQAQFSGPYILSVAVCQQKVYPESFTEEAIHRKEIREFMKKIEINPDDDLAKKYVSAARVKVEANDGRTFTREVVFRVGDWRNPASMEQIIDKFKSLMAYSYKKFSITKIDRLIQELDHLEKVQDMRRVIELLVP